ncbi:MAG: hypothetical protein ACI82A_001989 [Candidatus Azotimanducaceae bacterium]|jgi:hypothetical protein
MILMPEVALFGAATALLLTLVNCLMIFSAKRGMSKQMAEIRIELDANLSANHGLARHIRELQRGMASTSSSAFSSKTSHDEAEQLAERETPAEEPVETDTMSLAEKLGLSQSEAEIITHLRPRRGLTNRVRETA